MTIKKVQERREKGQHVITKAVPPTVDESACIACNKCIASCIYEAITVNDFARIDAELCYGCGLCADICPSDAIILNYYK